MKTFSMRFFGFFSAGWVLLAAFACTEKIPSGQDINQEQDIVPEQEPVPGQRIVLQCECPQPSQTSRAAVSDAGAMTWQAGDRIAVLDSEGDFNPMDLKSGAGSANATFEGTLEDGRHCGSLAVYPYSALHSWSETDGLSLYLPAEYTETDLTAARMPMIANLDGSGNAVRFRHIGSLMRFTLQDIPATASLLRLSSRGAKLSGTFALKNVTSGSAAVQSTATEASDTTVSVRFTRSGDQMSFFIPLPTVTLNGFTVEFYDGSGTLLARRRSAARQVMARARLLLMPAIALPRVSSIQRVKFIDYNIYKGMQNDFANNMDNFVAWVQSQDPDVLVLCEALTFGCDGVTTANRPMPERISTLAARWGHGYTAVGAFQDNYPVLVTSKHPLTLVQRLEGSSYSHGGLHVQVLGFDLVAMHTYALHTEEAHETRRHGEVTAAMEATYRNATYAGRDKWIFCGDLNSYWLDGDPADKYTAARSQAWDEGLTQRYLHGIWDHDVLYDWYGGEYRNTTYDGKRIDYFFVNDAVYNCLIDARIIHDSFTDACIYPAYTISSDHRPIQMVYERVVMDSATVDDGGWNTGDSWSLEVEESF